MAALLVLVTSRLASALPAPICDEHAQSMAAPFPLMPSHNGEASAAKPCEGKQRFRLDGAPAPERDQPSGTWADGYDRAPPAEVFRVARDRGHGARPAQAAEAVERPGFPSLVFRPPRAR